MQHEHGADVRVVESYVFDTLGAPFRVVLEDSVTVSVDAVTGEERVSIPDITGLMREIVRCRVLDPIKLSGPEVRFVRRSLNLPANKLAEFLDVQPEHYSRCEAGSRVLSSMAERLLRLFAFSATHYKNPQELLDGAIRLSEVPRPLPKHAERRATFMDVFIRMKIEAVRHIENEIEYVFSRSTTEDIAGCADCPDGDWQRAA